MALKFHFTDFPPIIAHRGLSRWAPENTLSAFRLAADRGLSWVECDVRLSHDGIPMVFHDHTLERTSNGSGEFKDYSCHELQSLDAGSWFHSAFAGEKIPTLDQLLDLAVSTHLGINIELKPNLHEDEITVEKVKQTLQKRQHNPAILFSSYSITSIQSCQQLMPTRPRAIVVDDVELRSAEEVIALTEELGCTSLHIHHQMIFSPLMAQCTYAPFDVMCFTVNDQSLADQCWRSGCASIFSDTGLLSEK